MKMEGGKRSAHTEDSNIGWAPETTGHEGECAGYMLFKKGYSILRKHIIFIWKVKHTYCFNNTTYHLGLHRYMENGSYIFTQKCNISRHVYNIFVLVRME